MYAFEVKASAKNKAETQERVAQLEVDYAQVFAQAPVLQERETTDTLPRHLVYTFDVDPAASPIEDVIGVLRQNFDHLPWYRVRTHRCRHNESPSRPCEPWEIRHDHGNVPAGA